MDIRTWRQKRHITQAQLAAMLTEAGYPATQGLVSFWELGVVRITPERASQLDALSNGELARAELVFGDPPRRAVA